MGKRGVRKKVTYGKAAWDEGNQSAVDEFILLGVSAQPWLELLLFVFILICYILTLLGNVTIIVISQLDPRLHTPMYFFLSNLSFLDLCYTTCLSPLLLVTLLSARKSISWAGCMVQLFIALALGTSECMLLAVMAYDRYAAVCHPLRYMTIMSRPLCLLMALGSWLSGLAISLAQTMMTMQLPLCGQNHIDHFSSHLAVVSLFFGTAIYVYLQPQSRSKVKIISLFYTLVTPMLNPLIYTLRNKEVHRALWKVLGINPTTKAWG
ncbi:olfactory receptor 2G6-like [Alligator mississippiensis]|uniref:olfactory receptor 2G6-like n=1 Tax=Alligator mississippiensis TaxID=8496 RepID=UPI002877B6A4|nr:olfactory receptor 2G6-like [Alligator mississippiensis]